MVTGKTKVTKEVFRNMTKGVKKWNLYDVFSPKEMQEIIIKLLKLLIEEVERALRNEREISEHG